MMTAARGMARVSHIPHRWMCRFRSPLVVTSKTVRLQPSDGEIYPVGRPAALACYLTCLPAGLLLGFLALDGLADVVAGGGPLVLRCGGPSGPGAGGFRRAGGHGECLADAAKAPADAGGGEAAGLAGLLPGQADVGGEVAGEAELGVAGDDQPGPAVGGGRVAELRPGPAELLLQEPERVLDVETA